MNEYSHRPHKRQKLGTTNHEHVTRADHVHQWLEFQQSADAGVKDGINTFKEYLTSVSRSEDIAFQSRQFQILKEYCQWQKAAAENQVDFYDVLSTWSFAVDNNVEAVISAVPAALSQFLKTISGILELRVYGLALIDSLLRREQSKLFERCLVSPRSKPHLASPCLRLLTEMICFDAGARSAEFWYRRDLIMPKFEAVLEVQGSSDDLEERKKPSVRRMALRFLIALLRYLDSSAKTDLLFQARALHKCIGGLSQDADDIVIDVLKAFNQFLLDDEVVPRNILARFFNTTHLEALSNLYAFEHGDNDAVRTTSHKLLLKICASEKGVSVRHTDATVSQDQLMTNDDDNFIDLGLYSPFLVEEAKTNSGNTALSIFIQKLQPQQDSLQSTLLVSIFKSDPSLLPEYFSKRRHPPAAASDDVVWRSYFAFIFAVVELPLAKNETSESTAKPPRLDTTVEAILPRPIDRSYLTKMLNSEDQILKISAARLTSVVLRKLSDEIRRLNQVSSANAHLWRQAQTRLTEMVEARLPAIRDINLAVQHELGGQACTASLECLLAYHQVLPRAAAATSFDVGPVITELCSQLNQHSDEIETHMERLAICTQIAQTSPVKWLHKSGDDSLSPFFTLVKIAILNQQSQAAKDILFLLRKVLEDRGVIVRHDLSLAAFYTSLTISKKFDLTNEVLLFVDNCMSRVSQKPVRYLDEIEKVSQLVSDRKPLSLLVAAIAEQWPFALKRFGGDKAIIKNISTWISRLFTLLDAAGENYRAIENFLESMLRDADSKHQSYLQDAMDKLRKKPLTVDAVYLSKGKEESEEKLKELPKTQPDTSMAEIEKLIHAHLKIPDSFQGLDRWSNELEIELEVTTKRISRLILCLTSNDGEVRLQAFQNLQKILHIVDTTSNYEGKQQVYLTLGELCETASHYGSGSQPLPVIIPELANALLEVAIKPTHFLFSKVNKFLLHKPYWSPKGAIQYWTERILQQPPESDESGAWNQEREWLLRLLICGLSEDVDLQLYRRCAIWEHVLSLYSAVCISDTNKKLIIALIWKGIDMPGGADILWTRFGLHSWLQAVDSGRQPLIQELRKRVEQNCTMSNIEVWKANNSIERSSI